ncbi:MAG: hypothetical protein HN356_11880 [Calditrichaeota bacterium]|nr:hypothetical protein [Calditrichota bacterium]
MYLNTKFVSHTHSKLMSAMIRIIASLLIFFIIGCAGGYKYYTPPPPVPDDRNDIPRPQFKPQLNDKRDAIDQQFAQQGEQMLDLSRQLRNLTGNPKEAYNVDPFGEVANSSWFTNRHAVKRMTIPEMVKGPCMGDGPDMSNKWTIVRAKADGVTPGFTIVDGRGESYVIKFDPLGFAGLNSGCEVISSKILYAMGFNVPENYISYFDPEILQLGDKVKIVDEKGRKRYMNEDDLVSILKRVGYSENGLIRSTASKYVPGKVIGPFKYEDLREDDPNDIIPHHHRRELRGFRVVAAWMNDIDAKAANSMDTWINEDGKNFVKHFLIDFGTFFGSGGRGPQPKHRGYENEADPHAAGIRILTLGLYVPEWEKVPDQVEYPSIGRYHSAYYHPMKWKVIFPNPAFDNTTDLDGYWGAKLVMSFTDEEIEAMVATGEYPNPEAANYLTKTIIERRDITGKYWFDRVTPIDRFTITEDEHHLQVLTFDDVGIETKIYYPESADYRYSIKRNGVPIGEKVYLGGQTAIPLPDLKIYEPVRNVHGYRSDQWEITIDLRRTGMNNWSEPVKVYLNESDDSGGYNLVGVRR